MIKRTGRGSLGALFVAVTALGIGYTSAVGAGTPNRKLAAVARESSIGTAEMDENWTIKLHIRAAHQPIPQEEIFPTVPWSPPEEIIGYGEFELQPGDLYYDRIVLHLDLGGLRPGESKPVPPWQAGEKWHCALDPDRGPCPLQHLLPSL